MGPGTCLRSGRGERDSRVARSNQSNTWRTSWGWSWWCWWCAGPSYLGPDPASHPSLTCQSRQFGVKSYLDFVFSVTQSSPAASHPVWPPDMFFFRPLELLELLGLLGLLGLLVSAYPGNEAPSSGEPGDIQSLHSQSGYRVSCCGQNFYHISSSLVGGAGSDGCQENQIG